MKGSCFFIQVMSVFSRREDKERVNKTVTAINENRTMTGRLHVIQLLPFYFHALVILFPTLVILFPTLVILFPKGGILITKGGMKNWYGYWFPNQLMSKNICAQISAQFCVTKFFHTEIHGKHRKVSTYWRVSTRIFLSHEWARIY